MGKFIDLTGRKFERLTVLEMAGKDKHGRILWNVICDCDINNKPFSVLGQSLREGNTKSCGCLQKEISTINGLNKKEYNNYDLNGEYGIGYCSNLNLDNTNEFYFDLDDYNKIKNYCWCFNKQGHVITRLSGSKNKIIKMSRLIMDINNPKIKVDHIKHKRYDNRKSQLRIATNQQNGMNQQLKSTNTSGVPGVYWDSDRNKWAANITYQYKTIHLGRFDEDKFEDAVKARKAAEEKYFGEWSYDNSMAI